VPTLAIFSFSPVWVDIGLPISIIPMPRVFLYYGFFFAVGWAMHRHGASIFRAQYTCWYGVAAGVTFGLMLAGVPFMHHSNHPQYELIAFATITAYNLFTWTTIFALIGTFLRWFNAANPVSRYFADASYWFYLAHLPLVLPLQQLLRYSGISPFAQFSLVLLGTVLPLVLSYQLLVRYTWIGTLLNGPREKRSFLEEIGLRAPFQEGLHTQRSEAQLHDSSFSSK
jgi:glucans biosynthesis protein C